MTSRNAHCTHVAGLLDEIADRIERGEQIDAVPASDLVFSWLDGISMSEAETLALRTLCAVNSRRMLSAIVGHRPTPDTLLDSRVDQAAEAGN